MHWLAPTVTDHLPSFFLYICTFFSHLLTPQRTNCATVYTVPDVCVTVPISLLFLFFILVQRGQVGSEDLEKSRVHFFPDLTFGKYAGAFHLQDGEGPTRDNSVNV